MLLATRKPLFSPPSPHFSSQSANSNKVDKVENMSPWADLEISLHSRNPNVYTVEFRCCRPDGDADVHRHGQTQIEFAALRLAEADHAAYGQALACSLFADVAVLSAFAENVPSSSN
jgi:hypothetical protein